MSLASLPSELYPVILDHLDDASIQSSILALTRAIPHAAIPLERFFERIVLRSAERVIQLHLRLRGGRPEAHYVRELRIESWMADAQVIINLLALLDNLTSLSLFVGPNFAPENLLEIFDKPRERLQSLSLRFRPYVQRANYYHFLKGAYFDPTISAIASWPSSSLHTLSVVQDPFQYSQTQASFAQPLVFFNFQPLQALSTSSAAENIHALRIRVPGRDVGPFLACSPLAFPALKLLDLSTGNIKASQLDRILARFDQVMHVRLDACALLAGREPAEWAALGMDCALIGVRRARDRERALKCWREAAQEKASRMTQKQQNGEGKQAVDQDNDNQNRPMGKTRAGRKGLATATVSLRGTVEPIRSSSLLNGTNGASTAALNCYEYDPTILHQKIRIVPLPPPLLTLTTTSPPPLPTDDQNDDPSSSLTSLSTHYSLFLNSFSSGWDAGIAQLRSTWTRLRTSSSLTHTHTYNNVRAMSLTAGAPPEGYGLDGLEDVGEAAWKSLEEGKYPAPVVCFAGEADIESEVFGDLHPEGCGHRVTRLTWGDPSFWRVQ